MLAEARIPYSRKRLEDLAVAMGVDSAVLWLNPVTNSLSLRDSGGLKQPTNSVEVSGSDPIELDEEEN